MKAELIINNVRLELGHRELNEISYALNDCERTKDIFHELAQSPSADTRSNIVSQNHLHAKTVRLLLSDSQIEVIRSMIDRDQFISLMRKEDIEQFINTGDSEILTDIVDNISDLTDEHEVCEKDWLCEKLYQQADPTIRFKLAENDETSDFILKKLKADSDINVSQAAQDTLDEIEAVDFNDDDDDVPM
ncbi:hypothetical protein [Desulfobacula sp.]|uniref:hypothetical protein n=1 Tax=Desulfobacula sp. TaxID=2593537 RepID=UPI0025C4DA1A|nr:hypothetical protein [Desulfobacula sp.]MBC2704288.1 hypothetical protein [Desulfobacula sp.]